MYISHCARSFLFSAVPCYNGRPLVVASDDDEYGFYCRWLVEYLEGLAGQDIPPCQKELCAELAAMKPDSAEFWLGEEGFYYSEWMLALERCIEDKLSYQEAAARIHPWWEEANEGLYPEEVEPFDAWINPQLWLQANQDTWKDT